MTEHYYSKQPEVKSEEFRWAFTLRGETLHFFSDRGVFSKREVDFGSRLLIETFEMPDVYGNVIDVGCGYGPIGLSIAKTFPDRTVHMTDVNERALALAKRNAQQNDVENVFIYESDGFKEVEENDFAVVLTNPPIRAGKKVVHTIFEEANDHLVSGGELWVVIQKKQGAPSALEKLEELFKAVKVVKKKKGYYIIKAVKN